jgi:acetyl esterase/lipase/quercetin dioxygenase-like cupin family protein
MTMQSESTVHHPLTGADAKAVAAMRVEVAPFKGKLTGPEARGPFDAIMEHTPDAAGVRYDKRVIGGVSGIWCQPTTARADAAILYLHGGAYVLGSANAYRHFAGQIAARTNTAVFVADYRLAPEHAFPAAVEDAHAAYRGLVEQGAKDVAIIGDSCGGGLSLVLLSVVQAEARAGRGRAAPAAVVMSPWTDMALTGTSFDERASADPMLTKEMLAITGASYLAGHDAHDPLASPLYGNLAGLPPIQLHVGTSEILLDDARRYAERARASGVDATVHVWEGMTHVFPTGVGVFDAADKAIGVLASFLDRTWTATLKVPPDDPTRYLSVIDPDDPMLRHISMVGDTYTILLSGADTAGRYCLIDMSVPDCGGPGPHRHDFEEMFTLLDGEIEFTFRGEKRLVKAGMTVNIPANAPHFFTNISGTTSRMLCMCSPAGQDDFFLSVGKAVASRTTRVSKPTAQEMAAFIKKAADLAPRYRTELLKR